MINKEKLKELLNKSPAERVTEEYIKSRISSVNFERIGSAGTLCIISLDNDFMVHGFSACVNPENYYQEIGEKVSYDNAFRQLWQLFGFLLAEKNKMKKGSENV